MTTKWSVPRLWEGEMAAILASGPSMTREQADYVRGKCRVIAVNNQGIDTKNSTTGEMVPAFAPWADILYAADMKWWYAYQDRALKFAGLKVCIRPTLPWPEVHSLMQSDRLVFDERPTHLVTGGNSGYQAVHLAAHLGIKRIVLLGFDMKDGALEVFDAKGRRRGRRHWFGNHPPKLNSNGNYSLWIRAFTKLAPVLKGKGIEVLNATPGTALRCFPRTTLEAAIK